jgi:hypothetical protein
LQNMENDFMTANDDYYRTAQKASNPQVYQGQGATAFLAAVDANINKSKYSVEGLGHVYSAITTLKDTIAHSSQAYDGKLESIANAWVVIIDALVSDNLLLNLLFQHHGELQALFDKWRNLLIIKTLNGVGTQQQLLDDILRTGDACILSAWGYAFHSVENIVRQDAHNIPVGGGVIDLSTPIHQIGDQLYLGVFHELANAVKPLLQAWANEIGHAYPTFQNTLSNFNYLSARDLFYSIYNEVDGTQSTNKPITITPYTTKDGKKGLLVTIAGTDTDHWWDSSIIVALMTGMGMPGNPYQADVENAIKAYLQEHPDMKGANVTFDGYSLGGMVAQNVTDDSSFSSKYNLHVTNVVTYGSPVMGPPARGVHYAMYDATYDPIPLLSSYENPSLDWKAVALDLAPLDPLKFVDMYNSFERADEEP